MVQAGRADQRGDGGEVASLKIHAAEGGGMDINSLLPRGKLFEDACLPLCVYFRNKAVFFFGVEARHPAMRLVHHLARLQVSLCPGRPNL